VKPIAAVAGSGPATSALLVVHTREGHLPDLSDAPPAPRSNAARRPCVSAIPVRWGRILIRGEGRPTTSFPNLYPLDSEVVIDKPGKGAFLRHRTRRRAASNTASRICWCGGVTTEVCVNTTVREANGPAGYRCRRAGPTGCASYFPEFHEMGLKIDQGPGRNLRLGR